MSLMSQSMHASSHQLDCMQATASSNTSETANGMQMQRLQPTITP
jgi:hypothetical protein